MNILVITQDYPDAQRSVYTFVKQLVDQFAKQGHSVCVVAPFSIVRNRRFQKSKEVQIIDGKYKVTILRPNHLSFSNIKIAGFSPSLFFRSLALNKALHRLPFKPDVIYSHFWRSGIEIFNYAKSNSIPLFVATGESVLLKDDINPAFNDFYKYVKGVICVSTKNMDESILNHMTTKEKCIVCPNGVNRNLFYKKDKNECRKELGFPINAFIVAFCGAFIHRKGVKILSDAIDSLNDVEIKSIFMGRPLEELPSCRNIVFQGPVQHEKLIDYLNSADVFVLPTLHEGCCNAIIEAMACGLPVISFDCENGPRSIVVEGENGFLIPPFCVEQFADRLIQLICDKDLRKVMGDKGKKKSQYYQIENVGHQWKVLFDELMNKDGV